MKIYKYQTDQISKHIPIVIRQLTMSWTLKLFKIIKFKENVTNFYKRCILKLFNNI